MTREEASFYLSNIDRRKLEEETNEALDMAIKALEQNESAEEWYKLFVEKLEQEPKTGKWKKVIDEKGYIDGNFCTLFHYECSICGTMNRDFDNTNYCPTCGTRMESEEV